MKTWEDTQNRFEQGVETALDRSSTNAMRRDLGKLVREFGPQAYRDGLEITGISRKLTESDWTEIEKLIDEHLEYVGARDLEQKVAGWQVQLWVNKTLKSFYYTGIRYGAPSARFRWTLGATEHCKSCLSLAGKELTVAEWDEIEMFPQSSRLACRGWFCGCSLKRVGD